jgi:hypothetical protein
MISQRNDIFPTLPVEIILAILDHLPLFESFRLQRVCSNWKKVFSQDSVLRSSLIAFETHHPSDSAQDSTSLADQRTAAKLSHVRALRCGQPFLHVSWEEPDVFDDQNKSGESLQLKGTRVAFVRRPRKDCDSVVVRDLVSGDQTILYGDAREKITDISLSSTLIAFTTYSGKLYTQDFSSATRKSVRLPSASIIALHADQDTVAVLVKGSGTTYRHSMAIFDFASGTLKLIDNLTPELASHSSTDDSLPETCISTMLMVNGHDKVVDLFDYTISTEDYECVRVRVEHVRYSCDGQRVLGPTSTCSYDYINIDPSTPRCSPSGVKDISTLTFSLANTRSYQVLPDGGTPHELLLVGGHVARFNHRTATLKFDLEDMDSSPQKEEKPWSLQGFHQVWKDMCFRRVVTPADAFLVTIDVSPTSG